MSNMNFINTNEVINIKEGNENIHSIPLTQPPDIPLIYVKQNSTGVYIEKNDITLLEDIVSNYPQLSDINQLSLIYASQNERIILYPINETLPEVDTHIVLNDNSLLGVVTDQIIINLDIFEDVTFTLGFILSSVLGGGIVDTYHILTLKNVPSQYLYDTSDNYASGFDISGETIFTATAQLPISYVPQPNTSVTILHNDLQFINDIGNYLAALGIGATNSAYPNGSLYILTYINPNERIILYPNNQTTPSVGDIFILSDNSLFGIVTDSIDVYLGSTFQPVAPNFGLVTPTTTSIRLNLGWPLPPEWGYTIVTLNNVPSEYLYDTSNNYATGFDISGVPLIYGTEQLSNSIVSDFIVSNVVSTTGITIPTNKFIFNTDSSGIYVDAFGNLKYKSTNLLQTGFNYIDDIQYFPLLLTIDISGTTFSTNITLKLIQDFIPQIITPVNIDIDKNFYNMPHMVDTLNSSTTVRYADIFSDTIISTTAEYKTFAQNSTPMGTPIPTSLKIRYADNNSTPINSIDLSSHITIQLDSINITLSDISYNTDYFIGNLPTEVLMGPLIRSVTTGSTINILFNNTISSENFSGNGSYFSVIVTLQSQSDESILYGYQRIRIDFNQSVSYSFSNIKEIALINYNNYQYLNFSQGVVATIPYDLLKYNFTTIGLTSSVPDPNPLYSDQPISNDSKYVNNINEINRIFNVQYIEHINVEFLTDLWRGQDVSDSYFTEIMTDISYAYAYNNDIVDISYDEPHTKLIVAPTLSSFNIYQHLISETYPYQSFYLMFYTKEQYDNISNNITSIQNGIGADFFGKCVKTNDSPVTGKYIHSDGSQTTFSFSGAYEWDYSGTSYLIIPVRHVDYLNKTIYTQQIYNYENPNYMRTFFFINEGQGSGTNGWYGGYQQTTINGRYIGSDLSDNGVNNNFSSVITLHNPLPPTNLTYKYFITPSLYNNYESTTYSLDNSQIQLNLNTINFSNNQNIIINKLYNYQYNYTDKISTDGNNYREGPSDISFSEININLISLTYNTYYKTLYIDSSINSGYINNPDTSADGDLYDISINNAPWVYLSCNDNSANSIWNIETIPYYGIDAIRFYNTDDTYGTYYYILVNSNVNNHDISGAVTLFNKYYGLVADLSYNRSVGDTRIFYGDFKITEIIDPPIIPLLDVNITQFLEPIIISNHPIGIQYLTILESNTLITLNSSYINQFTLTTDLKILTSYGYLIDGTNNSLNFEYTHDVNLATIFIIKKYRIFDNFYTLSYIDQTNQTRYLTIHYQNDIRKEKTLIDLNNISMNNNDSDWEAYAFYIPQLTSTTTPEPESEPESEPEPEPEPEPEEASTPTYSQNIINTIINYINNNITNLSSSYSSLTSDDIIINVNNVTFKSNLIKNILPSELTDSYQKRIATNTLITLINNKYESQLTNLNFDLLLETEHIPLSDKFTKSKIKTFNVSSSSTLVIEANTLDSDTMIYVSIDTVGYKIQFKSIDQSHSVIIEKLENYYKIEELNNGSDTITRYLYDGDERVHRTISYSIGSFAAEIVNEQTQNKFVIDISGLNTNTASIQYVTDASNYQIDSCSYTMDISLNYKLFDNIFYVKIINEQAETIHIWVDQGDLNTFPYYIFYMESNGDTSFNNILLKEQNTYIFHRLNNTTSHPFYISDTGYENIAEHIILTGDGSYNDGIIGSETFTLRFKYTYNSIGHTLNYYCTNHSNMIHHFNTEDLTNTTSYNYAAIYQHWPDISFSEAIISNNTNNDIQNFNFNKLKFFGPSWIAKNITGGYNNSDLFSNETELVNQYINLDSNGTIINPSGVKQKLQKKISFCGSFNNPLNDSHNTSANLSKVILDTLLRSINNSNDLKPNNSGDSTISARKMVDKITETGINEWINIEFSPNDTIQFKLVYNSSSITNESNIAIDSNGNQLGTNIIENQEYLVRINLINDDGTTTIPSNAEIKQIIPENNISFNNPNIDIDLSNIILDISNSNEIFSNFSTNFINIASKNNNINSNPFASSSLSLANYGGISHIDGTNEFIKTAGYGYITPTSTIYPGWHHFQNIIDGSNGFQNCWISNQGGELAYCGISFGSVKFISGFSIGGLGSNYNGTKNRHNGYHQLQVAFCKLVDHNTSSDNWFNIDNSFNRTNNGTFFYKFIKKNTNEDTQIYCTGMRILVQPFINSDNTFDALAIDEFEVYNDTQAPTHITPRMFSRFIDSSRNVSETNEAIITTYYVDSNATSNDISNNIDICRNYLNNS